MTDEGESLLRRIWPVYARVLEEELVGGLSETEARALADSLGRVGRTPAVV